MMIDVRCPACRKWLKIAEQYRGQRGQCAQCGAPIQVPKKSQANVIAISIVGTLCVMLLLGALIDPPQRSVGQPPITAQVTETLQSAQPTPRPVVAPAPISDITFDQIRNQMKGATSIQWEDFIKPLKGTRVQWAGWVTESREKIFGGYEVWIDMDPPNTPLSVQDISFDVTADVARSLSKGQRVVFTGTIVSVIDVLSSCQVNMKDAKIQ